MTDVVQSSESESTSGTAGDGSSGQPKNKPRWSRKRLIVACIVLLVLIVIVPPFINVNRYRRMILHSISAGLGRSVEASSVELQLFPRPGFVLHNLIVSEDPGFGAEPVMMAETVTAGLRASTLWHGRMEIASLRFQNASVNLVRNAQGHWNFESLFHSPVVQRHQNGTANTAVPFPYVEASSARINFKRGAEKLPFSLEQAHLEVWEESGHEWRMRIRAHPVRTDLSVAAAGEIRGEGWLRSRSVLLDSPVHLRLEWRRVQLGEITRLLQGQDAGWRGTVDWTAVADGTLGDASLRSDVAVAEFRRAEFIPPNEMDLGLHCAGRALGLHLVPDSLACQMPVGNGYLRAQGQNSGTATKPAHSVELTVRHVPAEFFLDFYRKIHPGVTSDLSIDGEWNGNAECPWRGRETLSGCAGEIHSEKLRLVSSGLAHPLTLAPVQLTGSVAKAGKGAAGPAGPAAWRLAPLHIVLGASMPATLTGVLNGKGTLLQLHGPADLGELKSMAQWLRMPLFPGEIHAIHGTAQMDLSLETEWLPVFTSGATPGTAGQFLPSQWTGSVQLQNATVHLSAIPVEMQLAAAQVNLLPGSMQWNVRQGRVAQIPFDGSFDWRVPCVSVHVDCGRAFALHSSNLNVGKLQSALLHRDANADLLNLIHSWTGSAPELPEMIGTVNADVLTAGKIAIRKAALRVEIQGHRARLLSISGKIFNGTLTGLADTPVEEKSAQAEKKADAADAGSVQWDESAPVYRLRVGLQHIQPNSVAALWQEHWGPGSANVQLHLETRGWSAAEMGQNVKGTFSLAWLNGSLTPENAVENGPLKFQQWSAQGVLQNRKLVVQSGRMVPVLANARAVRVEDTPAFAGVQSARGTIGFSRLLHLELQPAGISVTGPLHAPRIESKAR
jgi:hypothetical protein